jgi:UPF0755 protein
MRKAALVLIFSIVFVVGGAVLGGTILWTRITYQYKGYEAPTQRVEIPRGAGAAEIRRRLVDAGIVESDLTMRAALIWSRQANNLKAGEYQFERPLSALEVIDRLVRGDIHTVRITFPEGLSLPEMAAIFETRGLGTGSDWLDAARDPSLIRDLDPMATDLEGYLFPETYTVAPSTSASELVSEMVQRFRNNFPEALQQRAIADGFTVRQVVALAALVEKETARPDERPLVAAVYRNRLRIGMPMQADPTVIYALQRAGRYNGNLRRVDLAFDSPYNTYKYPGLPPGPIAAPGKAAIDATLAPADVKHLYFVSRNDGSHVFADTLAEHNRNVHEYQVLFFQRQRHRQRQSEAEGTK